MAAHLAYTHVTVPVGDWAVGRIRFEADALQSKDRRDDNRHRRTVQRPKVDSVECVMPRILVAVPRRSKFRLERVGDGWRQRNESADVQVVVRPAVEALPDA